MFIFSYIGKVARKTLIPILLILASYAVYYPVINAQLVTESEVDTLIGLLEKSSTFNEDYTNHEEASAHFLRIARHFRRIGLVDEAFTAFNKAQSFSNHTNKDLSNELVGEAGVFYYQSSDFKKASEKYYQSYAYQDSVLTNKMSAVGALNNYALCLFNLDSLDLAKEYFAKALIILKQNNLYHKGIGTAVLDNLAEIALKQGNLSESISMLKEKESIIILYTKDTTRLIETYLDLAEIFQVQKKLTQSSLNLRSAATMIKEFSLAHKEDIIRMLKIANRLSPVNNVLGQADQDYFLGRIKTIDRLHIDQATMILRKNLSTTLTQSEKLYSELLQSKEKELAVQRRNQWISWILTITLSSFIGYLIWNFIKGQRERIKNKTKENRGLIQDKYQLSIDNVKRMQWNSEVISSLSEMMDAPLNQLPKRIRKLYFSLIHKQDVQEKLSSLRVDPNHLNAQFIEDLKARFPDLTQGDLDMCSYIRLNLSPKEIAAVKGVSESAVRKSRFRLWKKMRLNSAKELDETIQRF